VGPADALDLRRTWSHEADVLWRRVDAEAWRRTHNPWTILQDISPERLQAHSADCSFVADLERLTARDRTISKRRGGSHRPRALQPCQGSLFQHGVGPWRGAAALLYAGGLGPLAGDFLKTANDPALPVIGVGLLYRDGYFRQIIEAADAQRKAYLRLADEGRRPILFHDLDTLCPGM
jgi:glycogen phosphorylase